MTGTMLFLGGCLLLGGVIAAVVSWREDKAWKAAWPDASALEPDEHGMIHHPTLGSYPAVVRYEPGMTLYPGQEVRVRVVHRRIESGPTEETRH